ncbi:DUF5696 domain-containing protein [Butyrivibrio proteoclasticus]|uniref:DUF5696 domain-containing protein n=1 Tax=Butyrivibrio proteoclasticus TaxID=43305 RepID=UPI0004799975|nr:DUF5696 domain-containing protein [Butyrivibrio proteoclasticus]
MKKDKNKKQNAFTQKILEGFLKLLPSIIVLLIIVGAALYVINTKAPTEVKEPIPPYAFDGTDKPVVIDNGQLKLTMDPATTEFTVEVKDSGKVWYSNPKDAAEDTAALDDQKNYLQSPFILSYSITQGLETTYNSFAFSAQNGIYEIVPGENEIRVNYSLGSVQKEFTIPPVITKTNFEKFMGNLDKKEVDLIKQYYKKYDINKLTPKDNKDELLASYPVLETDVIYVLRSGTKDNVRKTIQDKFEAAGYTYDDYLADKELDLSSSSSDTPVFNASVIYKLDGKDLVVEVPFKDLDFDPETPIYTVTPLPYFGAGGPEDQGFMLVPEGGGAIINFNNGKTSQSSYYTNVYGWDMCLSRDAVVHNTRAYYGVYGISEGNDSFVCILENGRSYASIQADIAGKNHSYNFVNAKYSVCQREQYDVGDIANSEIYEYATDLPDETITQRYKFVNSGSYVDMAKTYGEYLQKEYAGYLDLVSDTSTPVAIEMVGAIDKVKQIVGVPVSRPLKLTSYSEASNILDQLTAAGLTNMHVKLSGWCNGGVQQKVLSKTKTVGALGSKKDLQNLISTAEANGNTVYLNGITQYAFNSNILDGFFSYRDAAKFISKERAELYEYSNVTYGQRENADHKYFLLHTDVANKYADNLVKASQKYGAGASFQDLGMDLSSDFYKKKTYSREAVLNEQVAKLENYNNNGTPLMINMGNDYAVPFCQMVTGMDLRGSEYTIIDECIPFYQLAVHGRVDYTGRAINTCGNMENEILYSAEYGAGLCFELMNESSFATQKTLYTQYYGAYFDAVKDNLVNIYTRYNKELGHTFNQEMTGHDNLTSDVSCTEYADGTKVYVNYGYSDYTADGVKVPARDYVVTR